MQPEPALKGTGCYEEGPAPGYLNPGYAASLAEFGRPRQLPHCGGWILEREVPGGNLRDAMGCYPLFTCRDWGALRKDLEGLVDELVTISLVPDPFGSYEISDLRRIFPERMRPFKQHFVMDLSLDPEKVISSHHRYEIRKSLRRICVERIERPKNFLCDWQRLYETLISRHHITGIRRFSLKSFDLQLSLPGVVVFRALLSGKTVAAQIWYVHGPVATSHLLASLPAGYELGASYALHRQAIDYFRGRLRWMNLGAGAGTRKNAEDGLTRFKRGWASGTRTAYFCGRVLNRRQYERILAGRQPQSDYFPAYRAGEFDESPNSTTPR